MALQNKRFEPHSLIMTQLECFYCFESENMRCYEISHCFGIKACDTHYNLAIRDCNAYMHKEGIVSIQDIIKNVEFEQFFKSLLSEFKITQTANDATEDGWFIDRGEFYDPRFIIYDSNFKTWFIPIKHKQLSIRKNIEIYRISVSKDILDNIVSLLDKGVYLADYKRYIRAVQEDTSL